MLHTLQRLGISASRSRTSVSNDNPFSELCFRTLNYRPERPVKPLANLHAARLGRLPRCLGTPSSIGAASFTSSRPSSATPESLNICAISQTASTVRRALKTPSVGQKYTKTGTTSTESTSTLIQHPASRKIPFPKASFKPRRNSCACGRASAQIANRAERLRSIDRYT